MAFERIARQYTDNFGSKRATFAGLHGVVRVSMSKSSSPALHKLDIRVAADVAATLGWSAGDKVECLFGTGVDFGTVMVVRNDAGTKLLRNGDSTSLQIVVSRLPNYIPRDQKHAPETMPHRIVNGALLVELPAWATTPQMAQAAE